MHSNPIFKSLGALLFVSSSVSFAQDGSPFDYAKLIQAPQKESVAPVQILATGTKVNDPFKAELSTERLEAGKQERFYADAFAIQVERDGQNGLKRVSFASAPSGARGDLHFSVTEFNEVGNVTYQTLCDSVESQPLQTGCVTLDSVTCNKLAQAKLWEFDGQGPKDSSDKLYPLKYYLSTTPDYSKAETAQFHALSKAWSTTRALQPPKGDSAQKPRSFESLKLANLGRRLDRLIADRKANPQKKPSPLQEAFSTLLAACEPIMRIANETAPAQRELLRKKLSDVMREINQGDAANPKKSKPEK